MSQRPNENTSIEEIVTGRVRESHSPQSLDQSPEQPSPPSQELLDPSQVPLVDQSPINSLNVDTSSSNYEDRREPIPPEDSGTILRRLHSLSESVSENSQRIEEVYFFI